MAVEVARRYLEREYVGDSSSTVVDVVPYYDLDENRRLDLAGVDAEGEFVMTVEIERINHDVKRAVPEDFDKMASCDPEEAIWVVMTQSVGHDVLEALNEPPEGDVRVEKTYSRSTPPQQFQVDTPGLTAIYPVEWLKDTFLDADQPKGARRVKERLRADIGYLAGLWARQEFHNRIQPPQEVYRWNTGTAFSLLLLARVTK